MTPFLPPTGLLDGKHAVRFGDAIALLDVAADAYSCIYDPAIQANAVPLPDSRMVARATAAAQSGNDPLPRQWRDLPAADSKPRLRDVQRFAAALSAAAIQFRTRRFAALLRASGRGHARRDIPLDELAIIIARFERIALFLPVPILCLFRSFFLRRFLASYGCIADWVFGVTLFPFRAHCWLASGDVLLGETTDRAAQFSPILIVTAETP